MAGTRYGNWRVVMFSLILSYQCLISAEGRRHFVFEAERHNAHADVGQVAASETAASTATEHTRYHKLPRGDNLLQPWGARYGVI